MMDLLTKFWTGSEKAKAAVARVPDGHCVYAVGDIHGCADLFDALVDEIEHDIARREANGKTCQVVLLGDLVDRGPDSRRVIAMARQWQARRDVRILFGNHEEMFVKSFDDTDVLKHFLRHGGRETLLSYGIGRKQFSKASIDEVQELMAEAVPREDRDFLASFEDMVTIGDYAFVHAGVDPAHPLDKQKTRNLRWIREPFLSHAKPYEAVVVHGHTISDKVEDAGNRIGIDTGAYSSGRLTALVLQGGKRGYISAVRGKKGRIAIETVPLSK